MIFSTSSKNILTQCLIKLVMHDPYDKGIDICIKFVAWPNRGLTRGHIRLKLGQTFNNLLIRNYLELNRLDTEHPRTCTIKCGSLKDPLKNRLRLFGVEVHKYCYISKISFVNTN